MARRSRKMTSAKVASQAGRLLRNPRTPKAVRSVAASTLSHRQSYVRRKKGKEIEGALEDVPSSY